MLAMEPLEELDAALPPSADLSSWNFLQDLDFGHDLELHDELSPAAGPQVTASERVKERNRKAQQRFRQRKKVAKAVHA